MDGDDDRCFMAKITLRFIAALSFFSFLHSCFSGYNNNNNNIHFSTLFFSLFVHSLDRKYMFFISNAILAFLVKNFTFTSSIKTAQDCVIGETTLIQENAASSSVEYGISEEMKMETQQEEMKVEDEDDDDDGVEENIGEEEDISVEMTVEDESDYEEEVVEVEENKGEEEIEVKEASVSTEELNHKFEEFIRKMKEEIRIEALQQQQHLVAAS